MRKHADLDELIYDGQDKPQKRNETIWWDGVGKPGSAYRFEHDEKQRLVRAHLSESPVWQRRYEYDNHDNIIKSFDITTEERLYAENLTFDNKPSLFRVVPELQTLHDYIFLYDPSKNNVLTARIHDPVNTGTDDVSYPISYNEHGFIISSLAPTPYVYGRFYFDEVTYDCKQYLSVTLKLLVIPIPAVCLISDDKLDPYNRLLMAYLFSNYIHNLDDESRKDSSQQRLQNAVQTTPEYVRAVWDRK